MKEAIGASSRAATFNKEALARLGRIALGGQRISDVMEQTGLSRSTISKLLNQKMGSPPSVDTLRRLAGGNSSLFQKMLEACGHETEWQDEINEFHRLVQKTEVMVPGGVVAWRPANAVSTMSGALLEKKYGTQLQIDCQSESFFGIRTDMSDLQIIGVPVAVNDSENDARNVVNTAIRGITGGIARWGLDNIVVMILTNSPSAFAVLKEMPNLSEKMSVLLVSENGQGLRKQAVIEPLEKGIGDMQEFPFRLAL